VTGDVALLAREQEVYGAADFPSRALDPEGRALASSLTRGITDGSGWAIGVWAGRASQLPRMLSAMIHRDRAAQARDDRAAGD